MTLKRPLAAAVACCAALTTPAVVHADPGVIEAENIRKFNIMLMVTSLRCRTTEHDFREEYQRFNTTHLASLNHAGERVRTQMQARYGARGSKRALDRVGVQIANSYGDGHPWLGCAELKQITHDLSLNRDRARLSAAASELLAVSEIAHDEGH